MKNGFFGFKTEGWDLFWKYFNLLLVYIVYTVYIYIIIKQQSKWQLINQSSQTSVKIDYALEPIFVGSVGSPITIANRTAWVPKSQITEKNGAFEIKKWFANQALKGFNIKPYQI